MRGAAGGRGGHGAGSPDSLFEGGLLERELAESDLRCAGDPVFQAELTCVAGARGQEWDAGT